MIDLRYQVMQKKTNIIQAILLQLLLLPVRLFSMFPFFLLDWLGGLLGIITYYIKTSRKSVGLKNVSLCFPNMSERQKIKIIKSNFKYIGAMALVYSVSLYGSAKRIKKIVKVKNIHYLFEHYNKKPVIILCPHFIGVDLAGVRLTLEIDGYSMYAQQSSSLLTKEIKRARSRFMKHGYLVSR